MRYCNNFEYEKTDLKLGDGTEKHYYNCMYEGSDLPEDLAEFYRYIRTGEALSDLTKRIDAAVEKGRKNEIWRSAYMKERVIIMDAIKEEREARLKAEEEFRSERERAEKEIRSERERAEKAEEEIRKARNRITELEALIATGQDGN